MPLLMVRMIMSMYESQASRCRYFNASSNYYHITNGVRQGGVASPILFIVYMDELYRRLADSGFGLYVGTVYFGVVGYADDLLLLAASIYVLNKMLKICEEFGREFDILYNPSKSKYIVFNDSGDNHDSAYPCINDKVIPKYDSIPYLGNTISSDLCDKLDITEKCADLNQRTNGLIHSFGTACVDVKCKLFSCKCVHAYGSVISVTELAQS